MAFISKLVFFWGFVTLCQSKSNTKKIVEKTKYAHGLKYDYCYLLKGDKTKGPCKDVVECDAAPDLNQSSPDSTFSTLKVKGTPKLEAFVGCSVYLDSLRDASTEAVQFLYNIRAEVLGWKHGYPVKDHIGSHFLLDFLTKHCPAAGFKCDADDVCNEITYANRPNDECVKNVKMHSNFGGHITSLALDFGAVIKNSLPTTATYTAEDTADNFKAIDKTNTELFFQACKNTGFEIKTTGTQDPSKKEEFTVSWGAYNDKCYEDLKGSLLPSGKKANPPKLVKFLDSAFLHPVGFLKFWLAVVRGYRISAEKSKKVPAKDVLFPTPPTTRVFLPVLVLVFVVATTVANTMRATITSPSEGACLTDVLNLEMA